MDQQQFKELLRRFQSGEASKEEVEFLDAYYAAFEDRPDVLDSLSDQEKTKLEALLFAEMLQQLPMEAPVRKIPLLRKKIIQYAASLLIITSAVTVYWAVNRTHTPSPFKQSSGYQLTDVLPGKDGAVLTLANGRQVVLDSAGNGLVAEQSGSRVLLKDGALVYDAGRKSGDKVEYNTMRTPRGRQFRMELPDGTRVWLNAASSIQFPTSFTGTARHVAIEGEVYFEVTKDAKRPFTVSLVKRMEVEVLGTDFNINAYADEPEIRTTLLNGAVRVKMDQQQRTLIPGQQAVVVAGKSLRTINNADTDQVMSWKNGFFSLEDADIRSALRQLERWYDIEVRYEGILPDLNLKGELNRGVKLSAVINWLTEVGLKCRLEGRVLIVSGN